jgi:hypothetical protein
MYYFKIILTLWTAAFLALPTCPCQLFEPLGFDFPHRHVEDSLSAGNPDYNGVTELNRSQGESDEDLPLCHCDDAVAKTAEECETEELSKPSLSAVAIVESQTCLLSRLRHISSAARAPPSRLVACSVLTRSLTGVYRL